MNCCFAIALSILTLTCGALAEPISVTDVTVVDGDTIDAHGQGVLA
jgi:endonuclease YncB( thermonuclease family)